jgi:hypothetical protein
MLSPYSNPMKLQRLAPTFLVGFGIVSGCTDSTRTDDLGEIVYKIPNVPGADEPFVLPDLGDLPPSSGQTDRDDALKSLLVPQ